VNGRGHARFLCTVPQISLTGWLSASPCAVSQFSAARNSNGFTQQAAAPSHAGNYGT